MPIENPLHAPLRRKPGRRAKISREQIVQKSLEMLATTRVEDFMLKNLAHELGSTPMAIYNYFSSREELLIAVADEVCLLFKPPEPVESWQETLLAWLRAVKKHADHYPALPSIIGVNGHASPGWVKITVPITMLLHKRLGLKGKSLAMATYLFTSTAAAMIRVVNDSAEYKHYDFSSRPRNMPEEKEETVVLKKAQNAFSSLKQNELFDTFFAQLVKGIEVFL